MADENTNTPQQETGNPAPETDVQETQSNEAAKNLMDLPQNDDAKVDKSSPGDNLISVEDEKSSATSEGAPETYEQFTTPAGWELNESEHKTYSDLFRELNLTQAQAQKLVDAYNNRTSMRIKAQEVAVDKQITEWQAEVRKSPDFAQEVQYVRNTIRAINPNEAERLLIENRQFSNNPVIWGMFAKIGKLLSEDRIGGGGAMPTPKADENPYKINLN